MRHQISSFVRFGLGLTLVFALQGAGGWVSDHGFLPNLTRCCEAASREYPPGAYPGEPTPTPIPGFPPGVSAGAMPARYSPVPRTERWPVIAIGTVEKELGTIEAIRPDTADWAEPMIEEWIVVEVAVERVLKGEAPARITVQRLPRPARGTVGTFYLLRPEDRVLLFLDDPADGSTAYLLSWNAGFLKISLADSPAVVDLSKTSALDVIQAELVHGLEADDAYVVHEVMNALWMPEFFTEKAIPALKGLAKSPDSWLSLHALSLLSLRTGDQEAFEAVVRRAEAGDYSLEMGVLQADGTVTVDNERSRYLYNQAGAWLSSAIAGAVCPSALPALKRMAESTTLKPWLRKEALSKLSCFPNEPNSKLWRLFLEDSDPSLRYWAVDHMRMKFSNHPTVEVTPELNTKVNEEDFDRDTDKYVDLWLGFLNAFETEQASKGK